MDNRLLVIAASLALAFSGTPFAARAASDVPLVIPAPSEASLIGASTIAAPRALAVASYRGAVARVSASVVTVHSAHEKKGTRGKASKTIVSGLGSGVVINRDGDIVTNFHVVAGATELEVALVDGTMLPARVLGVDAESDIALLHVDAPGGLQPIAIADIEDVQPGDVALAIGNPLGIGQSVSQGIVSAVVRRGTRPVENFIQTDASINPGNSGGALIDTAGRLMGINAVILSHSGGSEGIGFAIPVDLVQTVAASLKAHGRVARGRFGWAAIVVPQAAGAVVVVVDGDGPAHRAGIVPGDVVMRVGARPVHRTLDAANVVLGSDPGTHVAVEIVRRGVSMTVDVELAAVPASPAAL